MHESAADGSTVGPEQPREEANHCQLRNTGGSSATFDVMHVSSLESVNHQPGLSLSLTSPVRPLALGLALPRNGPNGGCRFALHRFRAYNGLRAIS